MLNAPFRGVCFRRQTVSELLSTTVPVISNGVMAVGTAAGAMLLIALVSFGVWAVITRLLPD